jgi:hypothetical protein
MEVFMDLNHPLVQSVVLPLLMSVAGAGALRLALKTPQGQRWASAAAGLACVMAAAWLLGWHAPPETLPEKLPWVFMFALVVGVGLDLAHLRGLWQWAIASLAWGGAAWWLGLAEPMMVVAAVLLGAIVLGALLHGTRLQNSEPTPNAGNAAMVVVASLGLAGLAMASGSLLLFQLGLLLASAVGGVALWLWPRPRIAWGPAAAVFVGMSWLALAQATVLLTPVRLLALLPLAASFGSFALARFGMRRLGQRELGNSPVWMPLIVAMIAAVFVLSALAWVLLAGQAAGDDAYYQPTWSSR